MNSGVKEIRTKKDEAGDMDGITQGIALFLSHER